MLMIYSNYDISSDARYSLQTSCSSQTQVTIRYT